MKTRYNFILIISLISFLSLSAKSQSIEYIADEICFCFKVDSTTTQESMANCIVDVANKHRVALTGSDVELDATNVGSVLQQINQYLLDCNYFVELTKKSKPAESSISQSACSQVNQGEFWSLDSLTVVILDDTEIMYPRSNSFTRVGSIDWLDSCSYKVTLKTDGGDGVLNPGDTYVSRIIDIRGDSIIWETQFKKLYYKYYLLKK